MGETDEKKADAAEKTDEKKDEAEDKKEELFQVQGVKSQQLAAAPAVSSFAWLSVAGGVVALLTGIFVVRKRTAGQAQDSYTGFAMQESDTVDTEVEAPILG